MTRSRRLAAVWFADIAGYTELSSRDEEAALSAVDELQRLSRDAVDAHGGRIVKFLGDGVLTVFDSADAAVRAALKLQDEFSVEECALRIGVHLGEVVEQEDGDLLGDGVNVASRIEGQAQQGQVVVSEQVHQALRSQAAHSFEPFGPVRLKGVEEAQWLYALGDGPATAPAFTEEPEILESSWLYGLITKKWPQAAGGIIAVLAGAQWIAQGLTTSGVLESYLFAWGVVTTGLWFMFDKAERAVAAPVRRQAASSLSSRDFGEAAQTIPDTFVETFDTIFGKRHLSVRCLTGSIIASLIAVAVITLVWLATMWPRTGLYYAAADDELIRWTQRIDYLRLISFSGTSVLVLALIFNLLPDFASLLQTRLLIKSAHKRRGLWLFLGLDLLLTATLSVGFMYGVSRVVALDPTVGRQGSGASEGAPWEASPAAVAMWDLLSLQSSVGAVNIVPIEDWVIVEDEVLEEPRSPDEWAIREFATELQDRCPQSFGTIREANDNIDLLKRNGCWQGRRWDGDSFSWDRALMPEWLLRGVDQDSLSAVLVTRPPLFNAYSHSYVKYQSEWRGDGAGFPPGVLFYSAFFTSIWLWLYAASVLVSRVLLRMNSGVGFLLRVTDVEKQPFRSMGFVSVILVSCLFALGLPLVLL